MPLKIISVSVLLFFATSACEKVVKDVRLPEFIPKLVVASFITPGDTLSYIQVITNRRVFGEIGSDYSPGKLTGKISDGITDVTLDSTENGMSFSPDKMHVDYGKTYSILISGENGLIAEASTTVPDNADLNIKADTFSILREYIGYSSWREFRIKITFTDQAEKENFYRITGTYSGYVTYPGETKPYYHNDNMWFQEDLMTDAFAGNNGSITIETGLHNSFTYYDSAFMTIKILNTEESYYKYHKSLRDYSDNENPFTESTPVYSNITGGLGIFTSYAIDSILFRLK